MPLRSVKESFLVALFPALFGLALFDPGTATAQDVKQIKLTEKHIQGFMAADEEMAKIYGANVDNSDPKVKAHAEAVARKIAECACDGGPYRCGTTGPTGATDSSQIYISASV